MRKLLTGNTYIVLLIAVIVFAAGVTGGDGPDVLDDAGHAPLGDSLITELGDSLISGFGDSLITGLGDSLISGLGDSLITGQDSVADNGGSASVAPAESGVGFFMERAGAGGRMFTLSVGGVAYDARQAAAFDSGGTVVIEFSEPPADPGFTAMRNTVGVMPEPLRFGYRIDGSRIIVELGLEPDLLYKVTLNPSPLRDRSGRAPLNRAPCSFFAYAPLAPPARAQRGPAADTSDLRLSLIEAPAKAMFVVTSRATGRAVFEASVRIEGTVNDTAAVLARGKTKSDGTFTLSHTPEREKKFKGAAVTGIVVYKGGDTLAIDASDPSAARAVADNHPYQGDRLLAWLGLEKDAEGQDPVLRGFVRTERPVYHTDDTVFVKGYVREAAKGAIRLPPKGPSYLIKARLSGSGVESEVITMPVTLDEYGGFDCGIAPLGQPAGKRPAGKYDVSLLMKPEEPDRAATEIARTDFVIGIDRPSVFGIKLSGPDHAANDGPVKIQAAVTRSGGAPAAGLDVIWRVASYPHSHRPRGLINYVFSSEGRGAVSVFEEAAKTDGNGRAEITLNPGTKDGSPVRYAVEAIVYAADTQTVSARHTVAALPTLVLGARANRYVTSGSAVAVRVAALGMNDSLAARQRVTVSLKRLSWTRRLADSDFSLGLPEYIIEEKTERVTQRVVLTDKNPKLVEFKNQKPGVYAVELSSRDGLGRVHSVKIDILLAGNRPKDRKRQGRTAFEAVTDRNSYEPGQQAKILLRGPHRTASVMAVTERADGGLSYRWVNISNGEGTFTLDIKPDMAPGVPVTFLLTHPAGKNAAPGAPVAPSQPASPQDTAALDADAFEAVFNTTWIAVNPVANMLDVRLMHARQAAPGGTLDITVSLKDNQGRPRAGEAALWMVDESVMSQGAEKDLDPLEEFLEETPSRLRVRDTRTIMADGGSQDAGVNNQSGGEGTRQGAGHTAGQGDDAAEDSVTVVRGNPQAAFYWNPSIKIDKSGTATVRVPLTHDITNYAIRAIAVSGADKFGAARGRVAVMGRE